MTDEAHLFRSLDAARSDDRATPSANDVIHGFPILVFHLRIYVLAHIENLDKSRSSFCTRSYT
jgi:hypothetical protein